MSVIATCGHELTDAWFHDDRSCTIEKAQAKDGAPALSYAVRCEHCRAEIEKAGDLFDSHHVADRWLEEASMEHRWFLAFQELGIAGMARNATKRSKRK